MKDETNKKVRLTTRISAYLLDILLVFFVFNLITGIRFINPQYDKYVEAYEKYNEVVKDYTDGVINEEEMLKLNENNYYKVMKYSVSYNIVIILGLIAYFGVFQKFNNGQTLGKKIMKIKVVSKSGSLTLGKCVLRCLSMYFIYVGSIIPLLLSSVLVFFIKGYTFMLTSSIITYVLIIFNLVSLIMVIVRKDKRSLHDLISNTYVEYEKIEAKN